MGKRSAWDYPKRAKERPFPHRTADSPLRSASLFAITATWALVAWISGGSLSTLTAVAEEFPRELVDFVPHEKNPVFTGRGEGHWDEKLNECGWNGRNPLLERFYAGLWTWWAGVKGNMAWSYGWYVRINDQGLPESKLAWEGRLAGVNDYRYLQTLEETLAAAATSGQEEGPAIQATRRFLERLQAQISLGIWEQQPAQHSAEISTWNPVPAIGPEDYERIRQECAEHIIAVQEEHGF